jgi:hypothetical protein
MAGEKEIDKWEKPDPFGVGMLDDGSLASYSPEEARKLIAQRDADEASEGADEDIGDLSGFDKFFKKK